MPRGVRARIIEVHVYVFLHQGSPRPPPPPWGSPMEAECIFMLMRACLYAYTCMCV